MNGRLVVVVVVVLLGVCVVVDGEFASMRQARVMTVTSTTSQDATKGGDFMLSL